VRCGTSTGRPNRRSMPPSARSISQADRSRPAGRSSTRGSSSSIRPASWCR